MMSHERKPPAPEGRDAAGEPSGSAGRSATGPGVAGRRRESGFKMRAVPLPGATGDDVLAIVSHDLRTHLNSIMLHARMLERLVPTNDALDRIRSIRCAASRMNALVGDLLQAAAIEAGGLSIRSTAQDVASLATEAAASIAPLAEERAIDLELACGDGLPRVPCDGARILQVLSNLLGNAVKFTRQGGHVRLGVEPIDGGVLLSVADDGPGIDEADRPRIFDRYWKGRADGLGTGLGLHIAKSIVDAHGGRLWVESEIGRGSTFHVALPVARDTLG